MANLKSSIKDIRRTEKRTVFNKRMKERVKTAKKELQAAIDSGDVAGAAKLLPHFQKVTDKAAKIGVLEKNTASRMKARTAVKLNKATAKNAKTNNSNS
jgi:small subunit ribosomal protein S20